MRKSLVIMHLLTLTIGGCIYLFFRSDTLLMFNWADKFSITNILETVRNFTLPIRENLPDWFVYSLPDGLWSSSYVFFMSSIWWQSFNSKNIIWLTVIPITAIFHELGQLINIVPGTFDLLDLIFYFIGFFLPSFFILKKIKLKNI